MYIKKLTISGFGHFHNFEMDEIPPGLTVVEGDNEAGKTTLMAFIRASLFGYADRRGNSPRYEPLQGGEHGGGLILADASGETYRLERRPGTARGEVTIYHRDAVWRGEARVKDLLKGMSEHLFQQIFCFGLDELQRIETLDNDEVSGLIYSAGMGSYTRSYPEMQKELTEALGNLYKPAGRKPGINRLLKELAELDERIRIMEQIPEEYNSLKRELQEVKRVVHELEQNYRDQEDKENWLKSLQRVSEPFCQLKKIAAELQQLPSIDTFPEDGVLRLEGWQEKRQEVESALERLDPELADVKNSLIECQIDSKLLKAGSEIQELYAGIRLYQERLKEREQWEIQLSQRHTEVKQCIAELGPGWNPERVQYFPVTLMRRERIRDYLTSGKNLETEKRSLEQEHRQLLQWIEERERECSEKESEWNRLKIAKGARGTGRKILRLSLILSITLLMSGGWFMSRADSLPGILLIVTAAVLFSGGFYVGRLLRKEGEIQLAAVAAELEERRKAQSRVETQQNDLKRRMRSHEQAKADYDQEWRMFLLQDQLPLEMKPEDLLDLFKLVEKGKEVLRRYDEVIANRDHCVAEITNFMNKVNDLLSHLGRPIAQPAEVAMTVYRLQDEYNQQKQSKEQYEQLQERFRLLENEHTVLVHQLEKVTSEITTLLSLGQSNNSEEYRVRSQIYQERQALYRSQIEWQTAFQTAAAVRVKEMAEALERLGVASLEEHLAEVQTEKLEIKRQLDQLRQQQGRVVERLAQLETSEELSLLKQERENLVDELQSCAEEWMVLSISQSMLVLAKERYERERQPGVLQEASVFFRELTGGRYLRVLRSLGENRLAVERADERRLDPGELSRGTAEQLYLAMRFALVKEYGRRSIALPVIMDDILVNFDPQRTEQAFMVMARLAEENQILLFTCHSHIISLMRQAGIRFTHFKLTQSNIKRF